MGTLMVLYLVINRQGMHEGVRVKNVEGFANEMNTRKRKCEGGCCVVGAVVVVVVVDVDVDVSVGMGVRVGGCWDVGGFGKGEGRVEGRGGEIEQDEGGGGKWSLRAERGGTRGRVSKSRLRRVTEAGKQLRGRGRGCVAWEKRDQDLYIYKVATRCSGSRRGGGRRNGRGAAGRRGALANDAPE